MSKEFVVAEFSEIVELNVVYDAQHCHIFGIKQSIHIFIGLE